jgi:hypothetical protein
MGRPQQGCHAPDASCAQKNGRHPGLCEPPQHASAEPHRALENDALDEHERHRAAAFAAFVHREGRSAVATQLQVTAVEN